MEAQGLIQCLDSFLKKVSDFLNEVLAAEALSAPAVLKKLELIDNLDFIKFYHDPVSFIKSLVQRSSALTDKAACKCRARGFCLLPATAPRLLRARLDAFSAELRNNLAAVTVTTAASALLIRRRDLLEPDLEGWLSRRLGDAGDAGGCCKCYAVLCDAFLALFRSADDPEEVAAPAIVVSDKYVLEETTAQNNSYQFTVCGAGDRYTFTCKTQEDLQKWSDCLSRASRLRLQDLMEALKVSTVSATASAQRSGTKVDIAKPPQPRDLADRQRQPPEGAAAEPVSAAAGTPFGSAYPLPNDACDSNSGEIRTAAAAGRWSLDLGSFAIPTRRTPRRDGGEGGRGRSAERRRSMSSEKSSHSLFQSTAALLGSSGGGAEAASSDGALGRSPAPRSARDNVARKPPAPGGSSGGVRLRAKRSTAAAASAQRRARSLVIENGCGSADGGATSVAAAILDPGSSSPAAASSSSGDAVRRRSVGARISLSASTLFTNLAAARSALQQQRPTSSDRAKALLGSVAGAAAQIEGCLYYRGLLKWSKLHCKVVGGTLLGFKDAGSGGGGGQPAGEQPVLQAELRGCEVIERATDDAKARKARGGFGFKLCPAAALGSGGVSGGGKPLYFAADSADDLHRWLDVLRAYGGPKTATLREPTSDLTSGALQMVELGDPEKAADGCEGRVDCTTAAGGAVPKESFVGSSGTGRSHDGGDNDEIEWPVIFSDDTDLFGGIGLVASENSSQKPAAANPLSQLQQQGITLPSSPQGSRPGAGPVIIETEDTPRRVAEVEYQPDAIMWLSPASSVHSLRSSSTGDDSLANAVLFHNARDDLDLRQMSLQRRHHVLQHVIKEKERLQAVLASEKGKHGAAKQALPEHAVASSSARHKPTSPTSSSISSSSDQSAATGDACQSGRYHQLQATRRFEQQKSNLNGSSAAAASAKQRSSLDDITMLKQHMEGLKDKLRYIDRGLRQSLDPSLLCLEDDGLNLLLDDDAREPDLSGAANSHWQQTNMTTKPGTSPAHPTGDRGIGRLPGAELTAERHPQSAERVHDEAPQSARRDRTTAGGERVDGAAKNGPASATPSTLGTWSDLRSLIDSLDSDEGIATGARQGQMIVLGDF